MTIRKLMQEALALLSLDEETVRPLLYASLNRALDEVCREFPKRATERIYHALPKPRYAFSDERAVTPDAPLRISADGIYSFAFTAYGEGSVTVMLDGVTVATYTLKGSTPLSVAEKLSALSEKASGALSFVFRTAGRLYVTAFACYDRELETVIPYGEYYAYPVTAFKHRFLAFDGDAKRASRAVGKRTLCYGEDAVYLRFDDDGVYEIPYLALADAVDEDTLDCEPFMRDDAAALAVLLAAYYLAVEDEHPMASLLMARYAALRTTLLAGRGDETVGDIYGW